MSTTKIINKYTKEFENALKNGASTAELNKILTSDEVQAIMNCKLNIRGNQNANDDFRDKLSLLAERYIQHTTNNGLYKKDTTKMFSAFGIKSDRQYRRDSYDGQKRFNHQTGTKDKTKASSIPFSEFLCCDSEGHEFYTFEQYNAAQHNDTYFENELKEQILSQLTDEEKIIFNYHIIQGYSVKEVAPFIGLSTKQIYGRLDKIKAKTQTIISDIA